MLTIKDIAKKAGVSQATVSRVINSTKPVSFKTKKRVLEVIDECHYKPNVHAASLGKNTHRKLGIAYFHQMDESFAMLSQIERLAKQENIPIQIRSADMTANSELDAITTLLAYGCKAVMVHALYNDDETLIKLAEYYPQLYFIDRRVPGFEQRCVWFDHEKAGQLMVQAAQRNNPSQCYCVFRTAPDKNTQIRERAILNALSNKLPVEIIRTEVSALHGETVMRDILSITPHPESIIIDADTIALGALSTYTECTIDAPLPINIVDFGGSRIYSLYKQKITRINYPLTQMVNKLFYQIYPQSENTTSEINGSCLYPTLNTTFRAPTNNISLR